MAVPVLAAPAASSSSPPAGEAKTAPTPLALEQRKRLLELITRLRRPGPIDAEWLKSAEEVAALGEVGVQRIRPVVRVKLNAMLIGYQAAFTGAAKRMRAQQLVAAAKEAGKSHAQFTQELKDLRATVLDLRSDGGLTKERIIEKADPAMKRLDELLTVKPSAVLAGSEPLAKQREGLVGLWAFRDRLEAREGADADESLGRFEQVAAMQAMPIGTGDRRVLLDNARLAGKLKPEEGDGIRDLNRIRLLLGLAALRIDLKLCGAARDHSKDMREQRFFSHTSPVAGKRTPWDRAKRFGTSASAENIASGARDGPGVNRMWFHSPGHMKNMLGGGHRRVGLGYDGPWTQMFGR